MSKFLIILLLYIFNHPNVVYLNNKEKILIRRKEYVKYNYEKVSEQKKLQQRLF